ncbi:MAG: 2-amino-4-oxopentanoate thiolase subunit OrtA [Ignavibacteriales bacterium]
MERAAAGPNGKPEPARKGDWVQIYGVVLKPEERAPQVPEDTRKVPLEMRLKGFIQHDAHVGEEATIKTLTGRLVSGRLVAVNPAYEHDFGRPAPELAGVGLELRAMLQGGGDGA